MKHTELARNGTRNRRGIWKWLGLSLRGRSPWQSRFLLLLVSIFPYFHITCLHASDVKAKLKSANGSTSFQVRDSGDVVVSSITSDGDAHFNSLTFPAGGIADLRVKNEDLIITSTFVAATSISAIAENLSFADLAGFHGTLNVTQQPAIIYAVFSSSSCRSGAAAGDDTFNNFQITIDGNVAGQGKYYDSLNIVDSGVFYGLISVAAAWRVTTTGDKVVKVQQWHCGNMPLEKCTFSAFWVPCSP